MCGCGDEVALLIELLAHTNPGSILGTAQTGSSRKEEGRSRSHCTPQWMRPAWVTLDHVLNKQQKGCAKLRTIHFPLRFFPFLLFLVNIWFISPSMAQWNSLFYLSISMGTDCPWLTRVIRTTHAKPWKRLAGTRSLLPTLRNKHSISSLPEWSLTSDWLQERNGWARSPRTSLFTPITTITAKTQQNPPKHPHPQSPCWYSCCLQARNEWTEIAHLKWLGNSFCWYLNLPHSWNRRPNALQQTDKRGLQQQIQLSLPSKDKEWEGSSSNLESSDLSQYSYF